MPGLSDLCKQSALATNTHDLVALANCSRSPRNAWWIARKMGWSNRNCQSVKALATVYFSYGQKDYERVIRFHSKEIFEDICLCECHHGLKEENAFCECCTYYSHSCFCHCHCCPDCENNNDNCLNGLCNCECHTCCDNCIGFCFCQCHSLNIFDDYCDDCRGIHEYEDTNWEEEGENNDYEHYDYDDEEEYEEDIYDEDNGEGDEEKEEFKEPIQNDSHDSSKEVDGFPGNSKVVRVINTLQKVSGTHYRVIKNVTGDTAKALGDTVSVPEAHEQKFDENELAFILGHEIAHNIRNHPTDRRFRYNQTHESTGDVVGNLIENDHPFLGIFAGLVLDGIGLVCNRTIDRYEEYEADICGVLLAKKAGYDPEVALNVLHTYGDCSGWTSTHPSGSERERKIREFVTALKKEV